MNRTAVALAVALSGVASSSNASSPSALAPPYSFASGVIESIQITLHNLRTGARGEIVPTDIVPIGGVYGPMPKLGEGEVAVPGVLPHVQYETVDENGGRSALATVPSTHVGSLYHSRRFHFREVAVPAFTEIAFSANYRLETNAVDHTLNSPRGWAEYVSSSAYSSLSNSFGSCYRSASAHTSRAGPGTSSRDGVFSFSCLNDSDHEQNYFMTWQLSGYLGITPVVPEPRTYALLAAGLSMVGIMTTRRRRK